MCDGELDAKHEIITEQIFGPMLPSRSRACQNNSPPDILNDNGWGPAETADGLSDDRARSDRAARAARPADLRDPRRRRLPSLLPRPARRRLRRRGVPARALPRDAARGRALPRSDRGRGARADVGFRPRPL